MSWAFQPLLQAAAAVGVTNTTLTAGANEVDVSAPVVDLLIAYPIGVTFNNYLAVKGGNGLSFSERIR